MSGWVGVLGVLMRCHFCVVSQIEMVCAKAYREGILCAKAYREGVCYD